MAYGSCRHPLSPDDGLKRLLGTPGLVLQCASVDGLLIRAGVLLPRSNYRICTVGPFLNVFTVLCMMSAMSSPYDCQREARAAMSMALAATGDDRQKWVRVAIAWQELARNVADQGRALSSGQQGLPQPKCLSEKFLNQMNHL
jgi:hypothetical protein